MMPLQVVVLSHRSLFAGGIASRLREHGDLVAVQTVDAGEPDTPSRLRTIAPPVVVMDVTDVETAETMPIVQLLEMLPDTKVVQLNPDSDHVRIFCCVQRRAQEISELIQVMQDVCASSERRPGAGDS